MPTMTEMQEMVEDKVFFLMIQFEERVGNDACKYELNVPDEILFDKKGTTAGVSCFNYHNESGYLNFNPVLMAENWDHFIENTVVHEVAHYCTDIYCGHITTRSGRRQSHGRSWKSMMKFFGADAKRCHSYDVSSVKRVRKVKRFSYECGCGYNHEISTRKHNMIERGQTVRICSKCNGTLRYTGTMRMVGG